MTTKLNKVLYTAKAYTVGGRDGYSETSDTRVKLKFTPPGTADYGTNPEQMMAIGFSACFIAALKAVAGMKKITVPDDVSATCEVDLGPTAKGYGIQVRLRVTIPGMDKEAAQKLIDAAHQVCPYSNATRGNIPVDLALAEDQGADIQA